MEAKNSYMELSATKTYTLNCNGRLLVIDSPIVMGILNATPDSFYNKGRASDPRSLLEEAGRMIEAGATLLDIGGMSTRPGAGEITLAEEEDRVLPAITLIRKEFNHIYISVDTYRAQVARAAVQAGADIVNDISAGDLDGEMLPVIAGLGVPYIAMHMKGAPRTMQVNPTYDDVVKEVLDYFIHKVAAAQEAGIKDIIIDPGFGFGKNVLQNYTLLKSLSAFKMLDRPLLAGVSRKSMIGRLLDIAPAEALNGTTVLNTIALQQGASILRVHDIQEAIQAIKIVEYIKSI